MSFSVASNDCFVSSQQGTHDHMDLAVFSSKPASSFRLHLITQATASSQQTTIKAIKQTLRDWQEIIYDRLGHTRVEKQEVFTDNAQHKYAEDTATVKSYKLLCDEFKDLIQLGILDKHRILLLTDSEQRTQGLAIAVTKADSIYVKALMSAPWNIPMHGANATEHDILKVKGVGTTLMRHIYNFAKIDQKETIELKPLGGSYTFYKDQLKMESSVRDDGLYFSLNITKAVPEVLM